MRLVFLGTPAAAVPTLRQLVSSGHDVLAVVTRPDQRRGRGSTVLPSPVALAARDLGLPVQHDLSNLEKLDADYGVVVAYGAIIPSRLLESLPMLNVHFSLLPRWRGAAPVERAILAGDEYTGVSIMKLEETLDTGPVYASAKTTVDTKTSQALLDELSMLGAKLIDQVLSSKDALESPVPQSGEVTYAKKVQKSDYWLSPELTPVENLRRVRLGRAVLRVGESRLRVLTAGPCAAVAPVGFLALESDQLRAGCAEGSFVLESVVPEGGRAMSANDWWRGKRWSGPVSWSAVQEETF